MVLAPPGWEKDKNLSEEERASGGAGSVWDHSAVDAQSKLIISLEQSSERDQAASDRLVEDLAERTQHRPPVLVTTDEHPQYANSLKKVYGKTYRPRRRKKRGRKRKLQKRMPKGVVYATVKKTRQKGRVTDIKTELVYGTEEELQEVLRESSCS